MARSGSAAHAKSMVLYSQLIVSAAIHLVRNALQEARGDMQSARPGQI